MNDVRNADLRGFLADLRAVRTAFGLGGFHHDPVDSWTGLY